MKFRIVFWDVLPCKIIVDRRFRGTCCLHHQVLISLNSEISNCAGVNLLLLVRNTTFNVVFHSLYVLYLSSVFYLDGCSLFNFEIVQYTAKLKF
jgi:hypothetical protein